MAVHELASCVPDPHTVQAPQLAAPAVAANVVPALHAAQVLEAVPAMAPWPAWHWHTLSASAAQSLTSVVPLPQTAQALQLAEPATAAHVDPATHAGHVFVAPPTIAPCPAWQWHTRSLLGVHADSSAAPEPHAVHAAQTATPGAAVNVLPAAHAPQVLVEPPARSP